MQAASIPNVPPAKAPVPGAASLLFPVPQQSSPFAALFQTQLKAGNDAAKLPAAGRPKDSARAQDVTSITLDSSRPAAQLSGLVGCSPAPSAQALPIPARVKVADGTSHHDPVASTGSAPLPASATPFFGASPGNTKSQNSPVPPADARSVSSASSVRTNVPPTVTVPQVTPNVAALDPNPVTHIADTARNRNAPSSLITAGAPRVQDSARLPDAVAALPDSQNLSPASSVRTNVPPTVTVPQVTPNVAALDRNPVTHIADSAPNREVTSNLLTPVAPRVQDSAKPRDAVVAPPDWQSLSLTSSVRTNVETIGTVPQPTPHPAIQVVNSGARTTAEAPNHDAPSPLPPADAPQGQDTSNAVQTDRRTPASNTAGLPNFQALQAARAELEFLSLQTREATPVPANRLEQAPQPPPTDSASQFSLKLQTSASVAASGTPPQTGTKPIAIGVSTPTFHEALGSQAANIMPLAPDGAAPAKSQSKDTSNGSPGNDANTKPDHASNSTAGRTDEKGFSQTLETVGANTGSAHATSSDTTLVAAVIRDPVEPRAASLETKPGASSAAPLLHGQSMPAPAGADQPNVEHHDAQMFLANELPALHNALIEKNLHVDSLSVTQGMPGSTAGGPGSDTGQRGFSQAHPKAIYTTRDEVSLPAAETPAEYLGATHANARLSVLA